MPFLAMVVDVITKGLHAFKRELRIVNLGFLQADYRGSVFVDKFLKLMRSRAQAIDIERNEFHAFPIVKIPDGRLRGRPMSDDMVASPGDPLMCSWPWLGQWRLDRFRCS